MEFEMDIPHPDELQWLEESNAFMLEEECQAQFLEEDDQLLGPCEATPEKEEPPDQTIGKRNRSEDLTDVTESVGKRSKLDDVTSSGAQDGEEEECWLPESLKKQSSVEGGVDVEVFSGEFVMQEEKTLSRFALEIEGDCIPVTGPCGDRVFAKMCSGMVDLGNMNGRIYTHSKGLLFEPINVLIERLEEEKLKKVLEESFGSPSDPINSSAPTFNEKLWVEKYSPNCFTELLSDEKINREVLLWLKQWDSCVFGSHVRTTSDDVLSDLRRHSTLAHQACHNKNFKTFSNNNGISFKNREFKNSNIPDKNSSLQETLDPWSKNHMLSLSSPPEQKVLLLCGPPGLGKTTLAHVAAKHCGYRVVEINASDERSSSTIESKILDVVQMNSVMGDSKPKCLVIDEIDGALGEGKGAVDVILKMVLAEKNSNHENNDLVEQPRKSSRKTSKTIKLMRPVICICNDLYAPALRPLRGIAKVYKFVQPTTSRVVSRVNYICKMEGFKTNTSALSALADHTECDIRSCLNTLQFLHKKNETLNFMEIDPQVVGRKDISRTAYDVWKEVFQKRKAKRESKLSHINSISGEFDFMHSLISNRGEYELTMDGIFENFLQLSYHDPMMRKTISCLDNLGISDSLLRYTMQTQQMSLLGYQPFYVISMKNKIAQVGRPNIEWPSSIQRYRVTLRERQELLKAWKSKISPSISRHLSVESFVKDLVTPLLHILSPPNLRPVAFHLLSEREKDDLSQLVDTMVSYSITYKNSKIEHASKAKYGACSDIQLLCLDPSINNFISFKDYQPGYNALPLTIKELLVHEVENQRILRESSGKCLNQNNGSSSNKNTPPNGHPGTFSEKTNMVGLSLGKEASMQPANKTSNANRSYPVVGHELRKVPVASKKSCHRSNNFFDKFRKHCEDSKNSEKALLVTTERDKRPFLFKYNEGFTNAVKRPVRMRELF